MITSRFTKHFGRPPGRPTGPPWLGLRARHTRAAAMAPHEPLPASLIGRPGSRESSRGSGLFLEVEAEREGHEAGRSRVAVPLVRVDVMDPDLGEAGEAKQGHGDARSGVDAGGGPGV